MCEASVVTIRPGAVYYSYVWNDGSSQDQLQVSAIGKYWLTVTDGNGCTAADTITISTVYPNPAAFLSGDTTVCNKRQIVVNPLKNFAAYQWSNGATTQGIAIGQPGEYWLRVTDAHGCIGVDTVVVRSKECLSGLFVPNAFSPNGDRKNDVFKPVVSGVLLFYRFSVFNRFGQELFSTSDPEAGWDGTMKGQKYDANTFTWKCSYQFADEKPMHLSGVVVLIR